MAIEKEYRDSIKEEKEDIERRWKEYLSELPKHLSNYDLAEYEYHWRLEHDEYYFCHVYKHRPNFTSSGIEGEVELHHVSDNIYEAICCCGEILRFELLDE